MIHLLCVDKIHTHFEAQSDLSIVILSDRYVSTGSFITDCCWTIDNGVYFFTLLKRHVRPSINLVDWFHFLSSYF